MNTGLWFKIIPFYIYFLVYLYVLITLWDFMKKIFLIATALVFSITVFGQRISKIIITGNGTVNDIVLGLDENVQVYISKDGQISKWGFDRFIGYQENYNDYLEPYVGRVEYYSQNDDVALRGRVKYIGRALVTYYPSYEIETLRGKLKSIGSVSMDYYQSFEDKAMAGNLKSLGGQSITWYPSYENEALRGKLKTVGPTSLVYFGSFEDKALRGKIKSIGSTSYTYYTSFEQFSGSMKNGSSIVNANAIKYYIRGF
jgi:hypothetical protein